jgi:superfamily I DNA/RNA helicase
MGKVYGALGPAGTGKTTFGTRLAREKVAQFGPAKTGYLAFTKAAAFEAIDRTGGTKDDFPYWRTIHALCYRMVKGYDHDLRVIGPSDFKKFAKETGLDGAYSVGEWEDMAEVLNSLQNQGKTEWDACKTAYTLSRLTARSVAELDRAKTVIAPLAIRRLGRIEGPSYRAFVRLYDDFRKKNGLIDFTDMLEFPLRAGQTIDLPFVVVDEAQDLCPLHYAILEQLFPDAELWYVGDDDQAIYGWSGASADEFLNHIENKTKVILRQTNRFGQGIVDFSSTIIRRVKRRIEKNVIGVAGKTGRADLIGTFRPSAVPGFILHRHVLGCYEIAKLFLTAGIPFVNERGKDPLSSTNRVKAYSAIPPLAGGGKVLAGKAMILVDELMPSVYEHGGEKTRFVQHGGKKRIAELNPNHEFTLDDLIEKRILTREGAAAIRERRFRAMKHSDDLDYYDRVLKNGYSLDQTNVPVITTIHGSKGRQAPHVTIFSEASRRCWEDPDSEHRLAYVAATRTEGDLSICVDRRVSWANSPYSYPVEKSSLTPEEVSV